MVKAILKILFSFFITQSIFCQTGTIAGNIKTSNTEPLMGATIVLKPTLNSSKYAITDENGFFSITDVPYGDYTIEISSIEIRKESISIEHKNKLILIIL